MTAEYDYLTGRRELFVGAPAAAMVVLEHTENDDEIYFATSHAMGATYWNGDLTAGRRTGLIALFKKTRVIASRALKPGSSLEQAAPTPIRTISVQRLSQTKPAEASPQADMSSQLPWSEQVPEPQPTSADDADLFTDRGFVSMFEVSRKAREKSVEWYLIAGKNGSFRVSNSIAKDGDVIDLQVNPSTNVVRVGKVSFGGRKLRSSRQFCAREIAKMFVFPEDKSTIRVCLVKNGDWYYGKAELKLDDGGEA